MIESKFNQCADKYQAYRPGYPSDLFDFLEQRFNLKPGSTIADLGAGPGKASIPMVKRGWRVTAIEPSPQMIEQGQIAAEKDGVIIDFRLETAEKTELKSHSIDLITSAQAFHWFDLQIVFKEICRILKPGGGLAFWWNSRDREKAPYLKTFQELVHHYNSEYKSDLWTTGKSKDWTKILEETGLFTDINRTIYWMDTDITPDDFIGLTQSYSYVNAISEDKKIEFFQEIRQLMTQNAVNGKCRIPYFTELWSANLR